MKIIFFLFACTLLACSQQSKIQRKQVFIAHNFLSPAILRAHNIKSEFKHFEKRGDTSIKTFLVTYHYGKDSTTDIMKLIKIGVAKPYYNFYHLSF